MIVQRILDLDSRGFSPGYPDVEDMANLLLAKRGTRRVGKLWAKRFVKEHKELKTRFSRGYDFQRALCEDPVALKKWFHLVANMRDKYGITDPDFYNFDETGFAMGVIDPSLVITGAE